MLLNRCVFATLNVVCDDGGVFHAHDASRGRPYLHAHEMVHRELIRRGYCCCYCYLNLCHLQHSHPMDPIELIVAVNQEYNRRRLGCPYHPLLIPGEGEGAN